MSRPPPRRSRSRLRTLGLTLVLAGIPVLQGCNPSALVGILDAVRRLLPSSGLGSSSGPTKPLVKAPLAPSGGKAAKDRATSFLDPSLSLGPAPQPSPPDGLKSGG